MSAQMIAAGLLRWPRGLPGQHNRFVRRLKKWLLIQAFPVEKQYAALLVSENRKYLVGTLIPWIAQRHRRVLFVGTAPYTHEYERLFQRAGCRYATLDYNPSASVWGAWHHTVGAVQDASQHFAAGRFDAVVLNGVFGFGVNDVFEMSRALFAVHEILAPGGVLAIGWNSDVIDDPVNLDGVAKRFTLLDVHRIEAERYACTILARC